MLSASALADDPAANLQLALGIELAVLPPYLYALWSIKSRAEGAAEAALEAAAAIRAVVYEEMLHAGLVANLINALGRERPDVSAFLVAYPGPLPGHTTEPPYAFTVGLQPLSTSSVETFLRIEQPEWAPPEGVATGWITIGAFYEAVAAQLRELGPGAFGGGHQLPLSDNPGPGRMIGVDDLRSALEAIETVVDQGEGHRPKSPDRPKPADEDDDDHEVAHYYQFKAVAGYLEGKLIDPDRDVYPLIENPDASRYTPDQVAANRRFNETYSALLDSLQTTFSSDSPEAFGVPTELMTQLPHLASLLRNAGPVPGTDRLAGPTFEYLRDSSKDAI